MRAIGQQRVVGTVERFGCRERVTLDAGYLHHAGHGIARETQVMLQAHLGSVFNLAHRAAEELCGCGSRHRTRHTHLALAAHLRAGDGCVVFDEVADQPGRGQCAQDGVIRAAGDLLHIAQHRRNHAAGTARRRSDHQAARRVFL